MRKPKVAERLEYSAEDELRATQDAIRQVAAKYGKSPAQARVFLKKMGYLTKGGKVSRIYTSAKKQSRPAS